MKRLALQKVSKSEHGLYVRAQAEWLCRDTYFLISDQGVVYEAFSTPEGK